MKAYITFLATHGKTYADKHTNSQRYKIFKENFETIEKHNRHKHLMPFEMGINRFADMTAEEALEH
jgi:lantibiotic modifying enzyme